MITLGIETSCDETALALIETRGSSDAFECRVIASLVHSQAELHSAYGGVYPTLAKREHGNNLVPLLHKLLLESGEALKDVAHAEMYSEKSRIISQADFDKAIETFKTEIAPQNPELFESFAKSKFLKEVPPIDSIAVTEGPGLEPALWVGINFARMLGTLWQIPIRPVNHMEGHVVGSLLDGETPLGTWQKLKILQTPAIALLISGGHTELVKINGLGQEKKSNYEIIGQTVDDAVGEAFDKAARLLGLPYPGGPHISLYAREAKEAGIKSPLKLPRPMTASGDLNFSFSGLKTAVLYAVRKNADKEGKLSDEFKKGLAYEFETAVSDTLDAKLRQAIDQTAAQSIVIGGGVSANDILRQRFKSTANEYNIPLFLPSRNVSGDNALMIALAGALDSGSHRDHILKAHGTKRLGSN